MRRVFDLNTAVRYWMAKNEMTQADVVKASGLERAHFMRKASQSNSAKRYSPTTATCERLAEAFGTDLPTFIKMGMIEE